MDRQRGPPFGNRAVQIAFLEKRGAEIVVRVRKVGTNVGGLTQMHYRFIELAFSREHVADAVVNQGKTQAVVTMFAVGTDGERALKIGKRVVKLAAFHQECAEIRERDIVVFCNREGVRPKCLAVFPISRLLTREES